MSPVENIQCGCDTKNPLERDGTSQAQRLLAALDPAYISVDERKPEDLLMFALSYAEQLKYFNDKNVHEGDWVGFLKNDVSTLVSIIARTDLDYYRDKFTESYDLIFAKGTTSVIAETQLKKLFEPIKEILGKLDEWYNVCDDRVKLKTDLSLYYQSVFAQAYAQLISIDRGGEALSADVALGVAKIKLNDTWILKIPLDYRLSTVTNVDDVLPTPADLAAYVPQDPDDVTEYGKIKSAALAVSLIFDRFINSLISIIDKTPGYLKESLELFPYHKAHTGLFLTFIELFAEAQNHINKTTKRHLDFYYEKVLQLARQEAVADKVHVIFELAKVVAGTATFQVDELTLLKAGKDTAGNSVFFSTDESIVVSHAKAAVFSSMFIETIPATTSPAIPEKTAIYASPVANSADGIGAELDKDIPQWKAFGESQQGKTGAARTMPDALIGFAIGSPQLVLNEGIRVITVTFTFSSALDTTQKLKFEDENFYTFALTGPKDWLTLDPTKNVTISSGGTLPEVAVALSANGLSLTCTLALDETQPALAAYSSKVHLGKIETTWPALKVLLNNVDNDNLFSQLNGKTISSVKIKVDVDKVKQLIVQNDQAKFDPGKPFAPFSVQPSEGSSFYIGSEEIFYKKLSSLDLKIQWHEAPTTNLGTNVSDLSDYYANYDIVMATTPTSALSTAAKGSVTGITSNSSFTAKVSFLDKKKWIPFDDIATAAINEDVVSLFDSTNAKAERTISLPAAKAQGFFGLLDRAPDSGTLLEFGNNVQRGFMKLSLKNPDFQHRVYPALLMKAALITSLKGIVLNSPYSPVIKSIYAHYVSEQEMQSGTDGFFHIHPFGNEAVEIPVASSAQLIVPSFKINSDDNDSSVVQQQEGMLFVGLENANPDESVSMLVQVVEDSGDPDVTRPDKVFWSYLSENTWIKLQQSQVLTDTTNGFITSGIIRLAIPADATTTGTIMTTGYTWLRASTTENTAALCNVLDIRTQAVQASFYNRSNDLSRLATALPAETIVKLDQPVAEIKGAEQPFASFGGKLPELGNEYYRRVSERLHHKARAINMWDYERIVLENFPSIYKVKCVNHNDFNCTLNAELKPGSVCVVVISNLRNQTQVDALKPSTSIGTREEIKTYLQKRCSRFVRMEVVNPTYEEIQVDFKVKFGAAFDADKGYYRNQLESDIRDFLAPWSSDLGADIVFGGKIHASFIINFIEEREYVDYITDFEMYSIERNSDNTIVSHRLGPFEEIAAQTARSVLVSAPTHNVDTNLTTV
ncbi:MAG: baseplate J/gp47 family protein [Bacteroidota bacterium]|nr:baseplate J/gp47 family protein [Bacteroidota bacterium]